MPKLVLPVSVETIATRHDGSVNVQSKIDKTADQSSDTHCRVDKNSSEIPIKKSKFDRKPDGSVNLQSKVHGTYISSFCFSITGNFF